MSLAYFFTKKHNYLIIRRLITIYLFPLSLIYFVVNVRSFLMRSNFILPCLVYGEAMYDNAINGREVD